MRRKTSRVSFLMCPFCVRELFSIPKTVDTRDVVWRCASSQSLLVRRCSGTGGSPPVPVAARSRSWPTSSERSSGSAGSPGAGPASPAARNSMPLRLRGGAIPREGFTGALGRSRRSSGPAAVRTPSHRVTARPARRLPAAARSGARSELALTPDRDSSGLEGTASHGGPRVARGADDRVLGDLARRPRPSNMGSTYARDASDARGPRRHGTSLGGGRRPLRPVNEARARARRSFGAHAHRPDAPAGTPRDELRAPPATVLIPDRLDAALAASGE